MTLPQKLTGSLAVVLPRFGRSLGGGAETLVRSLVELAAGIPLEGHAPRIPLVDRVEVWTTCAQDHRTWENHHPAGETHEDGLVVRRFPVSPRNLEIFIGAEMAMQEGRPLSIDQQLDWLSQSVNSAELYQHIVRHGREFDAIIFAPYLFATSFWGSLIYPERSILVPCLHNEAYAYLEVFHYLFRVVRGFLFNTHAELELAGALYDIPDFEKKGAVVGMGFVEPGGFAKPSSIDQESPEEASDEVPYLLYSGRKETGKNLDLLLEYFSSYLEQFPQSKLELRLIGSGSIPWLDELPRGVKDMGFVSEQEKERLMRGALALCQPSTNESFSIVMMEAWLRGTPVIVHGDCPVTKEHVTKSQGGLYFSGLGEFVGVLERLVSNRELARELGRNGRTYVREEYSWDAVQNRLMGAFDKFGLRPCVGQEESEAGEVLGQGEQL